MGLAIEKGFLRTRVARRIFALFVFCALVPLMALAYFSFSQVSKELIDQAHRRLAQTSRGTGMATIQRFQFLSANCELLAEEILDRGLLSLEGVSESLRLRAGEPFAELTLEGEQVVVGRLGLTAEERAHLDAQGMLAKLRLGEDGPMVFLVSRVGPRGNDLHLVGRVTPGYFFGENQELTSEFVSVFGPGGDPVFAQEPAVPADEVRAALAIEAGGGEFLWGAERSYVASYWTAFMRPQYYLNLTFVTSQATDEVLQPVQYFRRMFALSCLLTLFVVLLLSLGQIRRELVPITELRAAAERIANEDHSQRVDIRTRDEFAVLGATFNEMSERIQERTEALENAVAVKDQFLANMCHEIRTPLNGILGYADLCDEEDLTLNTVREHVEIIGKSGRHLLEIVNDILDVSKMRAGVLSVVLEPCAVADVFSSALEIMRVTAEAKGLALRSQWSDAIPEHVLTDGARLRQVLLNLIGNAVKFTELGEVRVAAFMQDGSEPVLQVDVADTGAGLTPEEIGRVFDPFVQGDDSMTRRSGGTGLGLSIARALARELGGDVTCVSEPGAGSTFTLTVRAEAVRELPSLDEVTPPLPAPAEKVEAVEDSRARVSVGGSAPSVLVVEDVAINRKLAVALMSRQGYRVEEAQNGKVGVDMALRALADGEPFGVILMDMQMPVMDGYEATRELRAAGYSRPIVALTAHSADGQREMCLAAGCDEYVSKPFFKHDLLERVARWIASRPAET